MTLLFLFPANPNCTVSNALEVFVTLSLVCFANCSRRWDAYIKARDLSHFSFDSMRPVLSRVLRRSFAHIANEQEDVVSRSFTSAYDLRIRQELSKRTAACTPLPTLLKQLETRSGRVLEHVVPYESTPNAARRINFDAAHDGIVTVSHVVEYGDQAEVHSCSGFAISVPGTDTTTILTCSHTLQEVSSCWLSTCGIDAFSRFDIPTF